MKERNLDRDSLDLENAKIGPLFRALFFPTLIGMIFNSALTLIDGIFVGQGVGSDGLAAINIIAPLFLVTTGIGLMFGIGASVVASIRLAEDNIKAARIIMTQAFGVGSLLIGIMCLVCLMFPTQVAHLMGCSDQLMPQALDYLLWILPGMLFLFIASVGMMLARLDGSPRFAMSVQIVAAAFNISLDWLMIFPLGMGIKGAAIATSIGCIAAGIMVMVYFIWFPRTLRFYRLKCSVTSLLLTIRNTVYMMKIGFATLVSELAMCVMMITGNYMFMSQLGEAGVAAYAIACYLFPVVFSISNAVAQSAQPIISFNHGRQLPQRVTRALHVSLLTAIICGTTVSMVLGFGADAVCAMFLSTQDTAYSLATAGLPLFASCSIFFAINIAFIGYYQSTEQALTSTTYTLLRGIILLIPSFIFMPQIMGINGLWLAIPAVELLTCLVIGTHYIMGHRRSSI